MSKSDRIDQFSTPYSKMGDIYVWKSLMASFTGKLNFAMAPSSGCRAFLALSFKTSLACVTTPLGTTSNPK